MKFTKMGTRWISMIFTFKDRGKSLFTGGEEKIVKQSRIFQKMVKNSKKTLKIQKNKNTKKSTMPAKICHTQTHTQTHVNIVPQAHECSQRRCSHRLLPELFAVAATSSVFVRCLSTISNPSLI